MMRIAFVTNIRAPYRKLLIEEYSKKLEFRINVYYVENGYLDRNWEVPPIYNAHEIVLPKLISFGKYGSLNASLIRIVKDNDIIVIGGYEMPSYIILVFLCKLIAKTSILLFDGVSVNKIDSSKFTLLNIIKHFIITQFDYYFANGTVSKRYFTERYSIDSDKIVNQFLTIDILNVIKQKLDDYQRIKYRKEYDIVEDEKIIIYSGRLIDIKRVDLIIKAISLLDDKDKYKLIILGDGVARGNLINMAIELKVYIKVLGFTSDQSELFKRYNLGDLLILPSDSEPWGLVVNEAMAAGLPVIVSSNCGCSLDLVKNGINGYIFAMGDEIDLSNKIKLLFNSNARQMGCNSIEIIKDWTFNNSKVNFERLVNRIVEERREKS